MYGLTAAQVIDARQQYGTNAITTRARRGFWHKIIEKLNDPMIKILMVALGLNILFAAVGYGTWYETVGIGIAIVLATFISALSEYKNESAFEKLQAAAAQIHCKVYRDGNLVEVPMDDLVMGDDILVQTGDKIPVDGVVIDGGLSVNQSALNGETRDAYKTAAPGHRPSPSAPDLDDPHRVYRGTTVYSGTAVIHATRIGDATVFGTVISDLQSDDTPQTPLGVKLHKLARHISWFGYIGAIAIALVILFRDIVVQNNFDISQITQYMTNWPVMLHAVINALILGVTIIVMAVPEGLPLMVAIVSAMNMRKMLRDNVLVRKITGIETAGSVNILFSDKTGTLTQGRLDVMHFMDGAGTTYSQFSGIPLPLRRIISMAVQTTSAATLTDGTAVGGNTTDRAVLNFVATEKHKPRASVLHRQEFSSSRKLSAAQLAKPAPITFVMGAPEKILHNCHTCYTPDGEIIPWRSGRSINQKIAHMTANAMRLVAIAATDSPIINDEIPGGQWHLIGLMAIRDDVRPDAAAAVETMHRAGVQVVMITGDRLDTATAIARQIGLVQHPDDLSITSDDLGKMTDGKLKKILPHLRVVARALPGDKSRLVRVAQSMNRVVGMTGDGVNDSPALNAADVGFAMGSGCDVAKDAGDIIILDDNFDSIGRAVLYGRTIFHNIRKFIVFQLTINVAAVMISFLAPILGLGAPLTVVQILWINLVMDTFAALAFGGEMARDAYMDRPPIARTAPIVSRQMWGQILTGGLVLFGIGLYILMGKFPLGIYGPRALYTGFFTFFVLASVCNAFNARTDDINLLAGISHNKMFIWVMTSIVGVQILLAYWGGDILRGYGLSGAQWLMTIILAMVIIGVDIARKIIIKKWD